MQRGSRQRGAHRFRAASTARLALAALGLGVSLPGALGCSEDRPPPLGSPRPLPGCEDFSYERCNILAEGCQRELFALVACLRGDPEQSEPPPVLVLDEAAALEQRSNLGGMTEGGMTDAPDMMAPELDGQAFRDQVRGLELLGMLEPGLIETSEDVAEVSVSTALAYYNVFSGEVVIIDRGAPVTDLEANGVLAHEFVHALQDRRHDLESFGEQLSADSDTSLALSSLIEGEASLYEYLLMFAYSGTDLARYNFRGFLDSLQGYGSGATLGAGSPAVTVSTIFPYTFGTRYAGQVWLAGGSGAVDALYAAPPQRSWDVLLGDAAEPIAPQSFETAPEPIEGSELLADDVGGAWMAAAVLAGVLAVPDARSLIVEQASAWRGDRFWLYARAGGQSVAALWAIDWEDAAAAQRFASFASTLAPEGAVLHIDTSGAATRLVAVERAEDLDAWRAQLAAAAP